MAEQTRTPEQWLELFYGETVPAKREKYLEKLVSSGVDGIFAERLTRLWSLRYRKTRQGTADGFLGAWLDLSRASETMTSLFQRNANIKIIDKALNALCLSGETQFPDDMLFREMKNLALCYIKIYLENHRENILGFPLRTGKELKARRISEIVNRVTVELPQKYGMEKEFALLTAAAREALDESLPRDEEPEII